MRRSLQKLSCIAAFVLALRLTQFQLSAYDSNRLTFGIGAGFISEGVTV